MTVTESVRDALEQPEKVLIHLHPEGSFDVADHVVPTGREEVWRFTPLKRLRGIHQDAPLDGHRFEVGRAGGSRRERRRSSATRRAAPPGLVPPDRVSARRVGGDQGRCFLVDVPKEHVGRAGDHASR